MAQKSTNSKGEHMDELFFRFGPGSFNQILKIYINISMGFGPVVMLTLHVASMEWKWGVHGAQTSDIKATFGVYSLFLGHKSLLILILKLYFIFSIG